MKRFWVFAAAGVLITASALRAEESQPGAALDQAFSRQRALPGYVEHVRGRMPLMPGSAEVLTNLVAERAKEHVVEKIQEKVAVATAKIPVAAELTERATAHLLDQTGEALIAMGPEQEIGTIEHKGRSRREVFASTGEVVRADGRMAFKYNLGPQIAQMQVAAALQGEAAYNEVRSVRASIKEMASQWAQGGFGMLAAASAAFDEVSQLLGTARSSIEIIKTMTVLQKLSGKWQCQPDPLEGSYVAKRVDVQQLPDESIGDAPTHVYQELRAFAPRGGVIAPVSGDDEAPATGYRLQAKYWIRVADGLPLRAELGLPGGATQRMDFDYPAVVDFAFPECAAPP